MTKHEHEAWQIREVEDGTGRRYCAACGEEVPGEPVCGAPVRAGEPRECDGPARFVVRYARRDTGAVLDEHPACFRHGLAEVERHEAADGMSKASLVEVESPLKRALGL